MDDESEYETCEAFTLLFNAIKKLQNSKNDIKYQHNCALEKCKNEIETFFKKENHHPHSVATSTEYPLYREESTYDIYK